MSVPLMPKATAVWLVENTTLTFEQIALFCGLHPLEVQGIADGDVAAGMIGEDPVSRGLLSKAMLDNAQEDPEVKLVMLQEAEKYIESQQKVKKRYTPIARRQDKPDAIAWITKNHPEVTDAQISKLVGTTKSTIATIRSREHWNMTNIRPRDPVLLGLCTQTDLFAAIEKAEKRIEREKAAAEKAKAKAKAEKEAKAEKKKAAS